jgi:hypothetical protein
MPQTASVRRDRPSMGFDLTGRECICRIDSIPIKPRSESQVFRDTEFLAIFLHTAAAGKLAE